jgi:hypothetical protein
MGAVRLMILRTLSKSKSPEVEVEVESLAWHVS